MDFILDKKHEMARQLFAEFAEKEVKPLAQETDELEQFPEETVKKMQKQGLVIYSNRYEIEDPFFKKWILDFAS